MNLAELKWHSNAPEPLSLNKKGLKCSHLAKQRMSDINNKAICTHCGDSVPHDKYEQHLRDLHADADDSSDGDW